MDGVHFSCQANCGRCCDQPGGIVYLSPDDARRLADHAQLTVPDWLERDAEQTYDGRFVLKFGKRMGSASISMSRNNAASTKCARSNAKRSRGGVKTWRRTLNGRR